ncbi:glucans biosynthesis glucosyltransferase MdoH [Nevskia ramosa]|uniref:glucans biosynthesis glucosyltransferase MdoH n=1 Tax=Nevskia ramosa TaxID=64002 RepID=UPI003D0BFA77
MDSSSASPTSLAAAEAYCAKLHLSDAARADLLAKAARSADPLVEVHHLLAGEGFDTENPALSSIAPRLKMALDGAERHGEQLESRAFTEDLQGRVRLATMPTLRRASFTSRPWSPNPVKALFRSIGRLLLGGSSQRPEEGSAAVPEPDAPMPAGRWHVAASVRRFILVFLVIAQTVVATYYMTAVLPYHGAHALEVAMLILYAVLFAWVSAGFWTAMMGFLQLLIGQDRYSINSSKVPDSKLPGGARTAILMPICNENTARVFAGLRATYDSVMRSGQGAAFDFYILSDTSDPDIRVAELEAWLLLCREVGGFGRVHYRRRRHRIKRKSGNIADFCRRWGSAYKYMVILDADSVMSGACLVRLAQLMEANPSAGIIQTAPRASGRDTLYARIQQFATRVYGPLFTAGLHFWQLGESHYWGHNAIIRVAPFLAHCSLPRLPGRGALSGEILSHDFVEAALMRRAGWAVWIAYDLDGSYEEMPPNLLDELKRDRRWCQGNLMNFRLFMTSGLHPAHRAVFMTGVMAYLSAPLWFTSLVLSTALLAVQTFAVPQYFTQPNQLFPSWPEWHPEWAIALFSATATLLFLPKILAVIVILAKGARNFGGGLTLTFSMLMELIFSAMLAPVRMLFHAHFVTAALLGIGIQWKSPPREDSQTPWSEAIARHGFGTVLGVLWAALVYYLEPAFLWWLLPVVGALMLAIPLSVWSSKVTLGKTFKNGRFFLIPEEAVPPRELRWTALGFKRAPEYSDFRVAVTDPIANALVCSAGTARAFHSDATKRERLALLQTALIQGPAKLDANQKNMLLTDSIALSRLHHLVWTSTEAHKSWMTNVNPAALS